MNLLTKSGLLPSLTVPSTDNGRDRKANKQRKLASGANIVINKLVAQAPFGFRPVVFHRYYANAYGDNYPFAAYPPYPKSKACSILCNHPADRSTKKVIKKIKRVLKRRNDHVEGITGSGGYCTQRHARGTRWTHADRGDGGYTSSTDGDDLDANDGENVFVPEILFRRYTETDSRPLTPTTTAITIHPVATEATTCKKCPMVMTTTMATAIPTIRARRCVTPDPVAVGVAEKTRLILDLRKSYSQDSLNLITNETSRNDFVFTAVPLQLSADCYGLGYSSADGPWHPTYPEFSKRMPTTTAAGPVLKKRVTGEKQNKVLKKNRRPDRSAVISKNTNNDPERQSRRGLVTTDGAGANSSASKRRRELDQVGDEARLLPVTGDRFSLRTFDGDKSKITTPKKKAKAAEKKQKKRKTDSRKLDGRGKGDGIGARTEYSTEACETQVSVNYELNVSGDGDNSTKLATTASKNRRASDVTSSDSSSSCCCRNRSNSDWSGTGGSRSRSSSGSGNIDDARRERRVRQTKQHFGKEKGVDAFDEDDFQRCAVSRRIRSKLRKHPPSSSHQSDAAVSPDIDDKMRRLLEQELYLQLQSREPETSMLTHAAGFPQPSLALCKVFSRRNARFELPVDRTRLVGMTPLDYLKAHVHVTNTYCLVYRRIFKLHASTNTDAEYIETKEQLFAALAHNVGRAFSPEEQAAVSDTVGLPIEPDGTLSLRIDFRTWCGISALCERLFGHCFAFKHLSRQMDPCVEMENADFEFLTKKLAKLNLDPRLEAVLLKLRDC